MSTYSLEECRTGIYKTIENAKRLSEDAEYNVREGRHHSAALLGCYALDEFGKAFVLAKLVIEAAKNKKDHITKKTLKGEGFFSHDKKLGFFFKVATPLITGAPPCEATDAFAEKLKTTTWDLRNAVAYVGIDEESFNGPDVVDPERCESALAEILGLRDFVDVKVVSYWEQKFDEYGLAS